MNAKKQEIVKNVIKKTPPPTELAPEVISSLVLQGDLRGLNPQQKVQYYNSLCERIGLDPATQPFKLLKLGGKEVLYADKGASQQLCKIYDISTEILKKQEVNGIYIVTVRATNKKGRFTDEDGAVPISGLKGDSLANALMKTITKAKRRAVLALCGLGMLDETEAETIPNAHLDQSMEMPKTIENQESVSAAHVEMPQNSKVIEPEINDQPETEANPSQIEKTRQISPQGISDIIKLAKNNGYDKEDYKSYILSLGYKDSSEILMQDISTIVDYFDMPKEKRTPDNLGWQ